MMMPAYEETYLNDAMCAMGEMLDYAVHDCGCDGDLFFTQFLSSGVAEQFERGNPKVWNLPSRCFDGLLVRFLMQKQACSRISRRSIGLAGALPTTNGRPGCSFVRSFPMG